LSAFIEQMESSKRLLETFRGDFAPVPRLPFLLLIEEKEAKEDQGDDRLQVVRIDAEGCLSLHGVRWVGVGGSLGLSRGLRSRTLTSFSSLDRRRGSKRRSRR